MHRLLEMCHALGDLRLLAGRVGARLQRALEHLEPLAEVASQRRRIAAVRDDVPLHVADQLSQSLAVVTQICVQLTDGVLEQGKAL